MHNIIVNKSPGLLESPITSDISSLDDYSKSEQKSSFDSCELVKEISAELMELLSLDSLFSKEMLAE